ncbi:MAG TPA: hypothetical protein VGP92_17975 [Acidimicrobiia bacterium]|nr:hypothetical protein [Acidimicrobiia bacterium]
MLIMFSLGFRIVLLLAIRRSPTATRTSWTWVLRAPTMWVGVVLVIGAVSDTAGAIAFAIGMVVLLARGAKLVINAPGATLNAWRTIGDPDAWRGSPTAVRDADTLRFGQLRWHKVALGILGVLLLVLIATLAPH